MNKLSKYTQILVSGQNHFMFNISTEGIIALNPELAGIVLKHKEQIDDLSSTHPDLYNQMKLLDMIVPFEKDEAQDLVNSWEKESINPHYFGMIINPTLDCNLHCWYCYEQHNIHSGMNSDTIEAIYRLIDTKVSEEELKYLNVSFFGGEPLLYYKKVVLPILKYASEACSKNNIQLASNFTTNAVLLTSDIIKELNNIGLSRPATFQITLDGNREFHNSVRFTSKNTPTYDTIINNIHEALAAGNPVTVRLNYTDSNIESFVDIIEEFKDLAENERNIVQFKFEQVWQNKSKHKDTKKRALEIAKLFSKYGLFAAYDTLYQRHNCYADMPNNIVINYNGDIFKCTARDFTTDRREGVLNSDGTIIWNKLYEKRMTIKHRNIACHNCNILPLCNGGCSQNKLDNPVIDRCYQNMNENNKMEIVLGRLKEILIFNNKVK